MTGEPLRTVPIDLCLTGEQQQQGHVVSSRAEFVFYKDSSLSVSRIHPLGGPRAGGTQLHVYLEDERMLVDLGGAVHGVFCRFTYAQPSPSLHAVSSVNLTVHAELVSCAGARSCGAGWGAIACTAPEYDGPFSTAGDAEAIVEVSINGQDYSSSGLTFRYYDPASWRVHRFAPLGGPLGGNVSVSLYGALLRPLGDVRCRFTEADRAAEANKKGLAAETNATVQEGGALVSCASPPHWILDRGTQYTALDITLNGQHYMAIEVGVQPPEVTPHRS